MKKESRIGLIALALGLALLAFSAASTEKEERTPPQFPATNHDLLDTLGPIGSGR